MGSLDETVAPDPGEAHEDGADLSPGTILAGGYRVEARLGRGGMGVVYRATQLALDRQVAVKVLYREWVRSGGKLERLRQEALAASRLRHPNIVTVYDFVGAPDGQVYLVMEYLPGPPLDVWLESHPWAPPASAAAILKPVCSAVEALHRAGIVHRDIKPSNIILPAEGDSHDVIKIVDFGIARLAEQKGEGPGRPFVGTPEYVAPEIIDGRAADARSDVYSLGVTAYEVIVGSPPFTGESSGDVLLRHMTEAPRPAGELIPGLPPAVDEVLLRALEKDPARRYQSAVDFGAALEAAFATRRRGTTPLSPDDVEPAPAERRPSVLVVDDDAQVCALLRLALMEEGYEVEAASDGVEALMSLGRRGFDLIVSDIDMPNLDGFSLLQFKTQKGIATPVIFLTGREGTEDEIRGFDLGAEDFIRKPMELEVLLARVRRILARVARPK